eukprot:758728-Hanusia_phi.AAC.4
MVEVNEIVGHREEGADRSRSRKRTEKGKSGGMEEAGERGGRWGSSGGGGAGVRSGGGRRDAAAGAGGGKRSDEVQEKDDESIQVEVEKQEVAVVVWRMGEENTGEDGNKFENESEIEEDEAHIMNDVGLREDPQVAEGGRG